MGVAYVDSTSHTLLRWAWLMWTALVTHCSDGCGLCGQHLSHFAQMGVAYVDSTCHPYVDSTSHTLLKWAWLMWTTLVTHCSDGCGLCGQHLSHIAQMGMAYVDSACHSLLRWLWLVSTAFVTHCSNGHGLCGQRLSLIAQMSVAYVNSICHTLFKWA